MSICNVFVSPFYALLAVDSRAALIDARGTVVERDVQKAWIHGSAVVGGRGNLGILAALHQALLAEPQLLTVDQVLLGLEDRCARAEAAFEAFRGQHLPGTAVPALAAGCEVMVVGWSAGLERMRAAVATHGAGGWAIEAIGSSCVAPGVWAADQLPDISTPATMQLTAGEQIRLFQRDHPRAPIGGRLLTYEVTPGQVVARTLELRETNMPTLRPLGVSLKHLA